GEARRRPVEAAVGEESQAVAEVGAQEADSVLAGGRAHPRPQRGDGLLVGPGAVQRDDLGEASTALLPEGAGELASAAAEVDPALAGPRLQPGDGVGEQLSIGRQVALAPERLGAAILGP